MRGKGKERRSEKGRGRKRGTVRGANAILRGVAAEARKTSIIDTDHPLLLPMKGDIGITKEMATSSRPIGSPGGTQRTRGRILPRPLWLFSSRALMLASKGL